MPSPAQPDFDSEPFIPGLEHDPEALVVDLAGFEGPLDLLLALARTHKLDLKQLSMRALADQYIAFIDRAKPLRLEAAADYLVMAAWLTYLKSRLLLPNGPDEDAPSGEEMAALLVFRLQRLGAMREAAARLMARDRLGQSVFGRGQPEPVRIVRHQTYAVSMYDLLRAYADQRKRTVHSHHVVARRQVWSIKEARTRLERLFGALPDWSALDGLIAQFASRSEDWKTVTAASLGAVLELTREGQLELQQAQPYAKLYLRAKQRLKVVDGSKP
jgi:segregation and condensation protein A